MDWQKVCTGTSYPPNDCTAEESCAFMRDRLLAEAAAFRRQGHPMADKLAESCVDSAMFYEEKRCEKKYEPEIKKFVERRNLVN